MVDSVANVILYIYVLYFDPQLDDSIFNTSRKRGILIGPFLRNKLSYSGTVWPVWPVPAQGDLLT